ncbi:MAG: OmpA family protein [Sphingobacteriaceae bacterium]|nr:OmpA family protein [Sphingobacteriaceae bacterium]
MKKYLFLFLIFNAFISFAQEPKKRKAAKSFEKAGDFLQQDDYKSALVYLEETTKIEPEFSEAHLQMGSIYRRLKQFDKAKESFKNAIETNQKLDLKVYYFLGESEFFTGNYTQAKIHFDKFIQEYIGAENSFVKKTNKFINDCTYAIEAKKKPVYFNPINLGSGVNTQYRDYFPSITADNQTLIFNRHIDKNEDFFISKNKNGVWLPALPLSDNINTVEYNEGAQSISPDGLYIFFTGCNRPLGYGKCDIYISHKDGDEWSKPQNLGEVINTDYWESQPAISPDGKTLYFVSNRPDGYGGYDIYKSELDSQNNWGKPINLGPTINSEYDENTPFLHPDGKTLYFSSDGWPGLGNKDIFFSRLNEESVWSAPENMGYPINTHNEETGLIVTSDGENALFSSEKEGGFGNLDIYSFKMPSRAKPLPIAYVKGVVKDKETKKTLSSNVMAVNIIDNKVLFNDFTAEKTGEFLTILPLGKNYAFNVYADEYLFYSENFELLKNKENKPIEIEILLEKIKIGSIVTLKNIFFDTNKYDLLSKSITELKILTKFLNDNPSLAIEIQGHTDNVGDDKLNEKLSENRATAVYKYLIENKIDAKRLSFKGYGENVPVADNSSSEGQQQNRRTSFVIVSM